MVRFSSFRRGATLIEILVAIAILAILAAITIPAVLGARESMRRSQCSNNLRQIGIGLHSYEAIHGSLPTANSGLSGAYRSFYVAIFPHMELKSVCDSINFQFTLESMRVPNRTAFQVKINVLICPSEIPPPIDMGWTNYAGNRGGGVQKYGYNGVFGIEPIGVSDIRDGASQTAAVSEWLIGLINTQSHDAKRNTFLAPIRMDQPEEFDAFAAQCRDLDVNTARSRPIPKGFNWLYGEFGYSLYNHTLGPNQKSCINGSAYQQGAWTAGSLHNYGVNVLFADGRVSFVRDSVNISTWRALASRNGAEVVGTEY